MAFATFDVFTIAQEFEKVGFPKDHAKVIRLCLLAPILNLSAMEARFDAKFEAQYKDNRILRNLWQFLSMPGVSH